MTDTQKEETQILLKAAAEEGHEGVVRELLEGAATHYERVVMTGVDADADAVNDDT